jgi:hypothetical protein
MNDTQYNVVFRKSKHKCCGFKEKITRLFGPVWTAVKRALTSEISLNSMLHVLHGNVRPFH